MRQNPQDNPQENQERGESGRFFKSPGWSAVRLFVGLVLVGLAVLAAGIVFFAASLERREQGEIQTMDGIVVLTGGADRINEALALLERGKGRRLFISGVNTHSTPELIKRRWPGREHLFECCVDLDYRARNTFENAIESARWARSHGLKSLILVTASYHLPRARLEFEYAMPEVTVLGYPVVPEASRINRWWQEPALARILALEFIKYWAASIRLTLGISGR